MILPLHLLYATYYVYRYMYLERVVSALTWYLILYNLALQFMLSFYDKLYNKFSQLY